MKYGFAVVATVATLGIRLALDNSLGGQPTLVVFTLPIMLSAYLGGIGPGLLATGLSAVASCYYLLPPIHSLLVASAAERWQLFFVLLTGVVISALSEGLHRSRQRVDQVSREREKAEKLINDALKETTDLRAALDEHAIVAITDPKAGLPTSTTSFARFPSIPGGNCSGRTTASSTRGSTRKNSSEICGRRSRAARSGTAKSRIARRITRFTGWIRRSCRF